MLKPALRRAVRICLLGLLAFSCTRAEASGLSGVDLEGRSVTIVPTAAPVVVLFFTASDCPIANRYEPEILRLQQAFAPAHVAFWWVYPNPGDSAEVIRQHQVQYGDPSHVLRDTNQSLTQWAHATVTPEAAVFVLRNHALHEVYRGRIDDRYISFGQERPQARFHELEDAIRASLAGRDVLRPAGSPVGCSIVPLGLSKQ